MSRSTVPFGSDPFSAFERGTKDGFSETVNLTPLFTCRAALDDLGDVQADFAIRRANAERLAMALPPGWSPVLPHEAFRSGILLVRTERGHLDKMNAEMLRRGFIEEGIALTCYSGGIAGVSMPNRWLSDVKALELTATCSVLAQACPPHGLKVST